MLQSAALADKTIAVARHDLLRFGLLYSRRRTLSDTNLPREDTQLRKFLAPAPRPLAVAPAAGPPSRGPAAPSPGLTSDGSGSKGHGALWIGKVPVVEYKPDGDLAP